MGPHHVKGLCSNGSGTTEYDDSFHNIKWTA
jgi:hypothetical protein